MGDFADIYNAVPPYRLQTLISSALPMHATLPEIARREADEQQVAHRRQFSRSHIQAIPP